MLHGLHLLLTELNVFFLCATYRLLKSSPASIRHAVYTFEMCGLGHAYSIMPVNLQTQTCSSWWTVCKISGMKVQKIFLMFYICTIYAYFILANQLLCVSP